MADKKTKKTAKKKRTYGIGNFETVKLCAFWAMAIAGFMYLFGGVVRFLLWVIKSLNGTKTAAALNQVVSVVSFIGNIALIVAIAIPAYSYVCSKTTNRRAWKICYWIALVLFAFGVVLGMLGGLFG